MKLTLPLPGRVPSPFDNPSDRRVAAMRAFPVERLRILPWRTAAAKRR